MKTSTRFVYRYLFCFILIVAVDLLSSSSMPIERMYLFLMPVLALSLFIFGDLTSRGMVRRVKGCRWSIMVLIIAVVASLFVEDTLYAGALIIIGSFVAPFLRIRKYADQDQDLRDFTKSKT